MLLPILGILALAVAVILILAALQPSEFQIVRSTSIQDAPAAVFARVNDLHRFQEWSPWAKLDPAMKQTYEGPSAGTGAAYAWDGTSKVGAGRMTITESRAPELVRMRLEFLRPFKATNLTEFAFRAEGAGTAVTWTMTGRNALVSKIFCLFVNMDRLVGRDFEKGLAQLKAQSESASS